MVGAVRLALPSVAMVFACLLALTADAGSSAADRTYVAMPAHGLATALLDNATLGSPAMDLGFERVSSAGATFVRLALFWKHVAPARRSATFRADDPDDAGYQWSSFDAQLRAARAKGLEPIVTIHLAPAWAEGRSGAAGAAGAGIFRPDPRELAQFATAAARRYGGRAGLPRVRYWHIWNEPNASLYLTPQWAGRRPVSAVWYRRMLNSAARAVHAVDRTNVVVAGGLSPFTIERGKEQTVGPLEFMQELLCVTRDRTPRRTCRTTVEFDAWAHHPYTSGGPTREATLEQDASIGDLPHMHAMLLAAYRGGNIRARGLPRFWVTEFSWDTSPPDPRGLPLRLHARWVSEALYLMWRSGVSLVTWYLIRDEVDGFAQSGLYFRGRTIARDRPKPALTAFRFPFVAYVRGPGVFVWARTPSGVPARIAVQQLANGRWTTLRMLRTNRHGIVNVKLPRRLGNGQMRAKLATGAATSLAFSLKEPPDRYVCPFGTCQ